MSQVIMKYKKGFTLIEILVVIGIIAVLAAVVLIAINPSRQFKLARDTQRLSNVNAIINAIGQNISENRGVFKCNGVAVVLPSTTTPIKSTGGFDLAPCIVPTYLPAMPFDPGTDTAHFTSMSNYDTKYVLYQDINSRVTASSTGEITLSIFATR